MDEDAWVQYLNLDDPVIRAAQKVFKDKTAFPQKTDVQEKKDQKVARSHPDAFFNREIGKSYHIVALS
jgi:carboxyl-terminal processing protease